MLTAWSSWVLLSGRRKGGKKEEPADDMVYLFVVHAVHTKLPPCLLRRTTCLGTHPEDANVVVLGPVRSGVYLGVFVIPGRAEQDIVEKIKDRTESKMRDCV
jgi:hypothetical protein